MNIEKTLKVIRAEKNLSQTFVCEKTGLKRNTLCNTELGNRTASKKTIMILCNFYEIKVDDLYRRALEY